MPSIGFLSGYQHPKNLLQAKRDNFFPRCIPGVPQKHSSRRDGFKCEQLRDEVMLAPESIVFLDAVEKWEKIFSFIRVDVGYDVLLS